MRVTGHCHCGAFSFTALVDPDRVVVCHCRDCQTLSGAPLRAVVPTAAENVTITGQAKHYVKVADSGNRRVQAFCPECGTQLYATEADGEPKVLNLRVGCIDQRDELVPKRQIWCGSAVPWLGTLDAVPAHRQGPSSPAMPPRA